MVIVSIFAFHAHVQLGILTLWVVLFSPSPRWFSSLLWGVAVSLAPVLLGGVVFFRLLEVVLPCFFFIKKISDFQLPVTNSKKQ